MAATNSGASKGLIRTTRALQIILAALAVTALIGLAGISLSMVVSHGNGYYTLAMLLVGLGYPATLVLDLLMLMLMPVWSWLAVKNARRIGLEASAALAWLGYIIPVLCYWQPARSLWLIVRSPSIEAVHLRRLIVAWGVARFVSAPSILCAVIVIVAAANSEAAARGGPFGSAWLAFIALSTAVTAALGFLVVRGLYHFETRSLTENDQVAAF